MTKETEPLLYLDGSRGIYIPQDFALETKRECIEGVDDEALAILKEGPEHDFYWEAWDEVLDNAVLTDPVSKQHFTLHQDDDLWLVPEGYEFPEEGL